MTEHTELPWSATETKAGKGKVIDSNGFSVCACGGGSYAEQRANAQLIVTACNCHYRLVEALRDAVDRIDDMLKQDDGQAYKEAERFNGNARALLTELGEN